MKFQDLFILFGYLCTVISRASQFHQTMDDEESHPIEAVSMNLERMAVRLDKLISKLLGMKKKDSEQDWEGHEKDLYSRPIEISSRRMFGIPVKTENEWKKLAEKIRRKERKRDMRHWK